jgi:hypothetical protein
MCGGPVGQSPGAVVRGAVPPVVTGLRHLLSRVGIHLVWCTCCVFCVYAGHYRDSDVK